MRLRSIPLCALILVGAIHTSPEPSVPGLVTTSPEPMASGSAAATGTDLTAEAGLNYHLSFDSQNCAADTGQATVDNLASEFANSDQPPGAPAGNYYLDPDNNFDGCVTSANYTMFNNNATFSMMAWHSISGTSANATFANVSGAIDSDLETSGIRFHIECSSTDTLALETESSNDALPGGVTLLAESNALDAIIGDPCAEAWVAYGATCDAAACRFYINGVESCNGGTCPETLSEVPGSVDAIAAVLKVGAVRMLIDTKRIDEFMLFDDAQSEANHLAFYCTGPDGTWSTSGKTGC